MELPILFKALDSDHLFLGDGGDRCDAGADGLSVDQDSAGAALAFAAAVVGAGQVEIVSRSSHRTLSRLRSGSASTG